MNKSLLIASFAVLTANTFGMGSDYHGESSGGRNSKPQFQAIRPAPISYNQLLRINIENKKLIGDQNNQITLLNQQCREVESLVQTLQRKNESLESLLKQKNDEISNWKEAHEKQRLATKINADKIEEKNKEIKKVREGKEESESLLQGKDERIQELEFLSQEKNKKIAFERSFDLGYGTETDLRDICGKIVID